MAGAKVRILVAEGGGRHQVHAIRHRVRQDRRMPRIACSEERGQVVVVRKILLIVVAHGTTTVGIMDLRYGAGSVEKACHVKRAGSKRGMGAVPGRVASGQ